MLAPSRLDVFFVTGFLLTADDERRTHLVREFVATEDSYVHNLQVLVDVRSNTEGFPDPLFLRLQKLQVFARPLRSFARDKSQAILDNYQAKKIFVNVEELLAANHAFIVELNKSTAVVEGGERPNFGDVCAKHVGLFVASKVVGLGMTRQHRSFTHIHT
ncbi:hypothetical protein BC936DRAFT_139931 [Jimgerdemannia flammicorona]|uniref:DH domain-containing protein n=1 Tax=Jimgerdemannia flammicorona TaxID=994334 RepID=A0A433B8U1_9FUNG|nr:hypothetical protein BC936DRAFT_139931 [Jimgerdemannia flammicorona]